MEKFSWQSRVTAAVTPRSRTAEENVRRGKAADKAAMSKIKGITDNRYTAVLYKSLCIPLFTNSGRRCFDKKKCHIVP